MEGPWGLVAESKGGSLGYGCILAAVVVTSQRKTKFFMVVTTVHLGIPSRSVPFFERKSESLQKTHEKGLSDWEIRHCGTRDDAPGRISKPF